jgi:FkbM family methyltransferase
MASCKLDRVRGHTIIPGLLQRTSVVVDLGGNEGEFCSQIAGRFGCQCTVVEPSPIMFEKITASPLIKKLQYAMSGNDAPVEIHLSRNSEATGQFAPRDPALGSVTVPGLTLQSLLSRIQLAHVDLLKVDIEGSEIAMFAGAPDELFRDITQISVEFHDANGITALPEIRGLLARMEHLGFFWISFTRHHFEDVLFINQRFVPLSAWDRWYLRAIARNTMGLRRMIHRALGR